MDSIWQETYINNTNPCHTFKSIGILNKIQFYIFNTYMLRTHIMCYEYCLALVTVSESVFYSLESVHFISCIISFPIMVYRQSMSFTKQHDNGATRHTFIHINSNHPLTYIKTSIRFA